MPLVFPDNFYLIGVTPQSSQFELDRITRHFKTPGATEEQVLSCPTLPDKGSPHPIFPFMFLTDRQAQETSERACALDLNYAGAFSDDGHGNPILPPVKNENDDQVASASSKKTNNGIILESPATAQYYAPTTSVSFFSYLGRASPGSAPDPTDNVRVITLTIGDTSYSPSGIIDAVIAQLFTTQIVETTRSPEVVAGKYWQNVSKKTKTLFPWIFGTSSGNYLIMYSPGLGYSLNDSLVINDGSGHTATLTVTALGVAGSISHFAPGFNNFTASTPSPIFAAGGSGSGAAFYVYHI